MQVITVNPGCAHSLQDALDKACPGDVVLLLAGEHRSRATLRYGGRPGVPVTIRGEPGAVLVGQPLANPPDDLYREGVDGLPSLGSWAFLTILRCGHVAIVDLEMRDCWPTGIYIEDSWDVSVQHVAIDGGAYPIFARDTQSKSPCTRGIAVRNSSWVQDKRLWHDLEWKDVHHDPGKHVHLNGAMLGTADVLGDIVFCDNEVSDAFNALRFDISERLERECPEEVARRNRNIFVYGNTFRRIRDNVLEPEFWAFNLHFHRNLVVDAHAPLSLDGVGGGYWYVYGNIFRFETRQGSAGQKQRGGKIIKLAVYPNHPRRNWYVLNNSFYCRSSVFGDGEEADVPIWNLTVHDNAIACGIPDAHRPVPGDGPVCQPFIDAFGAAFVPRGDTEFAGTLTNLASWPIGIHKMKLSEERAVCLDAASPIFEDAPRGDMRLRPGIPGRGVGGKLRIRMPGEEWFDWPAGLDIGAEQSGEPSLPRLPMRSVA